MELKGFFYIALLSLIQGCSDISMARIASNDLMGKDVDVVKTELTKKGLVCGQEYSQKTVGEKQIVDGVFVCFGPNQGLACPESQRVTIFFEPESRKVLGIGKSTRTNCY